jgi:uncharacterized membrane protein YedE/YeeE
MENFTPVSGLIGGMLIGLAAVLFLALNGRIAGISGVLGSMLGGAASELPWRAAFIAGLVAGPVVVALVTGVMPLPEIEAGWPILAIAGLLVGFGTRLGSGCTSGHGVCGIARGSARSIAATMVFMAVAAAVVFAVRHLTGG